MIFKTKKIYIIALKICVLIICSVAVLSSAACVKEKDISGTTDDASYISDSYSESGLIFEVAYDTASVIGYDGAGGNICIPASYNGFEVYSISKSAFESKTNILSVSIPSSVKYINSRAFYGCSGLKNVIFSNGNVTLGESAFANSGLIRVILPDGLETVERESFANCVNLVSATVPDSVKAILYKAFADCTSLTEIIISDNNGVSVSPYAFENTPLTDIAGAYRNGNSRFLSDKDRIIYDIAVDIINEYIGKNYTDFQKVLTVHDYIIRNTAYDENSFDYSTASPESYTAEGVLVLNKAGCDGYTNTMKLFLDMLGIECRKVVGIRKSENIVHSWVKVKLGDGWYNIDPTWDDPLPDGGNCYVRYNFFLVTDKFLEENDHFTSEQHPIADASEYAFEKMADEVYTFEDGDTYTFDKRCLVAVSKEKNGKYTVKESVELILDTAFKDCELLTEVFVNSGCKAVGNYAFWGCTELSCVYLPSNVRFIGEFPFIGNNNARFVFNK